jgi:hypothetical protein
MCPPDLTTDLKTFGSRNWAHPKRLLATWSLLRVKSGPKSITTACRFWANTGHQLLAHHARVKLLNISGGAIRMLSSAQVQTRAMARMSRADSAL